MSFKSEISEKRISIIGAGVSGRALAVLASSLGAEVFVSDTKSILPEDTIDIFHKNGVSFETGGHSERSWDTDLLVLSSGISPDSEAVREGMKRNIPIIGEIDFVYPFLNGRIIGVTGSNGKTTTTSLIGHFFEVCGYKTAVAGNIGNPAALYANTNNDFIVLELSSFQLYWSKCLQVDLAVITNLAPDHIDWHGSYANYVNSKANLLLLRKPEAQAIIQKRDMKALNIEKDKNSVPLTWGEPCLSGTSIVIKDQKILLNTPNGIIPLAHCQDIPLVGTHNVENVAMALSALSLMGVVHPVPKELFKGFNPPPHRCQFVAEINGVRYIDDSKGTNVAASVTAINSIEGNKIVILGGQGKGENYHPLAESLKKSVIAAIVLGDEKPRIIAELQKVGYENIYDVQNMEEAVSLAYRIAVPGITVLLSPACTSWDMYASYKKRGEHFHSLVNTILKGKSDGRNL